MTVALLNHTEQTFESARPDWSILSQPIGASQNVYLGFFGTKAVVYPVLLCGPGHSSYARGRLERVRVELERLNDGWAGEGSVSPSDTVLRDFDRLTQAISMARNVPEVEVDDESGSVTLRWVSAATNFAFSFLLRGDHNVVAILTELGEVPRATPRRFGVNSDDAIVRFLLDDDRLAGLLGYA